MAGDEKRPSKNAFPVDQDELLQMFNRAAEELTDEDFRERECLVDAFSGPDERAESQPRDL